MKVAERHIKHNQGTAKKEYVLRMIKEYLKEESFDRYEPFIDVSIDFIITISKDRRILKDFKKRNSFVKKYLVKVKKMFKKV